MAAEAQAAAAGIVATLRRHGHLAYFAGGCVRDLLLGREPQDFDVATSALPQVVLDLFPRTFAVGARFGVVLVSNGGQDTRDPSPREEILTEVATFRRDGAYSDGRRPDNVLFSTAPEEDVARRDFTINGMLLDPAVLDSTGCVSEAILDFVGGRQDLAAGLIRAIGEPGLRFQEDKLRLLRAVRFAARYRFAIEEQTLRAIRLLAGEIGQVSCERVREELTRMLTEGQARLAFELLDRTGLLAATLPEIAAMKGVQQPPQFHPEGDVWTHTLLLLEKLPAGCSPTLAWAALLHDAGKPPTFRIASDRIRFDGHVEAGVRIAAGICSRLRFSGDDARHIGALVENHMRFADVRRMKESTLKRFFRLPRFEEHLELHRLDCLASHGGLELFDYARERYEQMPPAQVKPKLLLTGKDLIAEGLRPGPQFKELLALAEDAQLEGTIRTREEGMTLVRRRLGGA